MNNKTQLYGWNEYAGGDASDGEGPEDGLGVECLPPDQTSLPLSLGLGLKYKGRQRPVAGDVRKPVEVIRGLGSVLGDWSSLGWEAGSLCVLHLQAGGQATHPERLAVPPGTRDHPPAVSRHRRGQAPLLQALGCLCTRVGGPRWPWGAPAQAEGQFPSLPSLLLKETGHLSAGA